MADLPLPEALIASVAIALFGRYTIGDAAADDWWERVTRDVLAESLAFRGESGHRVVWTWEEVEPLIEVLEFYVEHYPMEAARAALARVRGPEPAENEHG